MSKRTVTDYIVFHCSATPPSCEYRAADIWRLHTAPKTETIPWGPYTLKGKGWKDNGYGLVVPRDGSIEIGRGLDEVGAHVKGYNQRSASVVFVGGVSESGEPEDNFTPEQWRTFALLAELLEARYPSAKLLGHRDLSPDANGDGVIDRHDWLKLCPSFSVEDKLSELTSVGQRPYISVTA